MRKLTFIFVLLIVVSFPVLKATSTNLNTHCLSDRAGKLSDGRWVSYFNMPSGIYERKGGKNYNQLSHEQFLERVRVHFTEEELQILDNYQKREEYILCRDKYDLVSVMAGSLMDGYKPSIQSAVDKNAYFAVMAREIHGDKYDYSLVDYIDMHTEVQIYCKTHKKPFFQTPAKHIHRGQGCSLCGLITISKKVRKNNETFLKEVFNKNPHVRNNNLEIVDDYQLVKAEIKVKNKYGEGLMPPERLLLGNNLTIIAAINKTEYWVNMMIEKFGDKWGYELVDYVDSETNVTIICKKHGKFDQEPSNHSQGQGCPKCDSSKGEEKIENCLIDLNVNFFQEHKFENCKNIRQLPFDFYLPDYNILIEYDGGQHFKSIKFFGGIKGFQKRQKLDQIKTNFAKENGYNLIRISYKQFDDIDSIIKNLLT